MFIQLIFILLILSVAVISELVACPAFNRTYQTNTNRVPSLLYSFPGSGNTWVRLLIDWSTGIFSGSFYLDKDLYFTLPGEKKCDTTVSVLKAHPHLQSFAQIKKGDLPTKCNDIKFKNISHVIFLIRDPFDAIWSEFNRRVTNSHVNKVSSTTSSNPNIMERWHRIRHFLSKSYATMWAVDYRNFQEVKEFSGKTAIIFA